MAANKPLEGIALIDCAKANAPQGADTAARLCGYGEDVSGFRKALAQAGEGMGVTLEGLEDLITDQYMAKRNKVMEVAPDSTASL